MKAPIGIGAEIRRFRERQGWTQDEFAERLTELFNEPKPIARAQISQLETERMMYGDDKLRKLEEFMGMEPGTLILAKFAHNLRKQGIDLPRLDFDASEQRLLTLWRSDNMVGLLDFVTARLRADAAETQKKPKSSVQRKPRR